MKATGNCGTPIWQMVFLRFGSGKTSFHVFDGPRKARGGQSLFLGMWVTESRIQQISIGKKTELASFAVAEKFPCPNSFDFHRLPGGILKGRRTENGRMEHVRVGT